MHKDMEEEQAAGAQPGGDATEELLVVLCGGGVCVCVGGKAMHKQYQFQSNAAQPTITTVTNSPTDQHSAVQPRI